MDSVHIEKLNGSINKLTEVVTDLKHITSRMDKVEVDVEKLKEEAAMNRHSNASLNKNGWVLPIAASALTATIAYIVTHIH